MYTCICMYMYTYTYIYIHFYFFKWKYIGLFVRFLFHVSLLTLMCLSICTGLYMYILIYMRYSSHTYEWEETLYMNIYFLYIYLAVYVWELYINIYFSYIYSEPSICMRTISTYIELYMNIYFSYIYSQVLTLMCLSICTWLYMYIFIYMRYSSHTYMYSQVQIERHRIYIRSHLMCLATGWRRLTGCLKLQVIFRKRATYSRALFLKMAYEDKSSYDSASLCICTCLYMYENYIAYIHIQPSANRKAQNLYFILCALQWGGYN